MMLNELTMLLDAHPVETSKSDYQTSIVDFNILDKPTESSRIKSCRIITDLYGLDHNNTLFRTLRTLHTHTPESLPQLALILAFCRDALLRASSAVIFNTMPGLNIPRQTMEEHFESLFPEHFSEAMKKSLAQNVNTSWTFAGHLQGRTVKTKSIAPISPAAASFAMLAAHLLGYSGALALESPFGKLISNDRSALTLALMDANTQNLCDFRISGGVTEIRFPQLLTDQEIELIHA